MPESDSFAHVASWDGQTWSRLGSGTDSYIWAFLEHNGSLYAGGTFNLAGANVSNGMARWDKHTLSVLEVDGDQIPDENKLGKNFPNPFNSATLIPFSVARPAAVTLKVYNSLGQVVSTIVSQELAPGNYIATWNGQDGAGRSVATGIYFCRIQMGDFTETEKMLILK